MARIPARLVAVVLALVLMATAACTSQSQRLADGPSSTAAPVTYVAVGASDSVGVGTDDPTLDAWPVVLTRTALPAGSTLDNFGRNGATVASALDEQLAPALATEPTLVTVFLAVNDLRIATSVATYEAQLSQLVGALRRDGSTRVLLGNLPPVDHLPLYRSQAGTTFPEPAVVVALVADFNEAISRVADETGAELVDLHAVMTEAIANGTVDGLISGDGFHPSTAGNVAIADAFAAVLELS